MGKTPERGVTGPVMRYRRKMPTTAATATSVGTTGEEERPVETTQPEDNQMEHRETEPVVDEESGSGKREALRQTQKPLNPGGPARKKPKGAIDRPESPVEELPLAASTDAKQTESAPMVTVGVAAPKKKQKKRQLPNATTPNETDSAKQQQDVEAAKPKLTKQNSKRKQKSDASNTKQKAPSLLKQLLWKAKPVQPPLVSKSSSSSATDSPHNDGSSSSSMDTAAKQNETRQTVEDQDEQEEMAYAASERHNRKLQASKNASKTKSVTPDTCDAVAVVGGELSSQDTQSGSDEEASTEFLTAYENLVPSKAIEPKDLAPAALVNSFYPTPFPLALVADVELLKQHRIKVHEILIEDFAFHPPQLRVQPGDVVVWKMSNQTLGMVEHSLEASMMIRDATQKRPTFVKASTPTLGNSSSFAWRFESPSRIHIECSVYKTKGVVAVAQKPKKDKKAGKADNAHQESAVPPIPTVTPTPTKQQKWKEKLAMRKRAAAEARAAAARADGDIELNRDSIDSDAVFHPPQNLARSAEIDAGVCRAVLTQLEEVAGAARAASDVIVIGDVECPVLPDHSNQDEFENPANSDASHLHPDEKPSALADEWSGTEEDDDDEDERENTPSHSQENEIEDFQQRIIGMLKRSEETRAQHRRSFHQEESGFDAGAAYDFFKQRFMRVQEERQIVYATCPEQQSGCGVNVTEVVNLLAGSST